MIFTQYFDQASSSYSYLIGSRPTGMAAIIDPVQGHENDYLNCLSQHDLKLAFALDTHTHTDHVTAMGALRDRTACITVMSEYSKAHGVSRRVKDKEIIEFDDIKIIALYTPGHTNESLSYLMTDRVFTGDTLLIGGTGRTDFQYGNSYAQYDSLFNKLLTLPDETLVYPAHDYHGNTVSTIGAERANNPRLKVADAEQYAALMASLNLPNPILADVALPLNPSYGQRTGNYPVPKQNFDYQNQASATTHSKHHGDSEQKGEGQ